MILTELQKRTLNKYNVCLLLKYVHNGIIEFPADFVYVDEIKIRQIEELLKIPRKIDDFKDSTLKEFRKVVYNELKDKPFEICYSTCFVLRDFDIDKSDSYCSKCGHRLIMLTVTTPYDDWVHKCGREYIILFCHHCNEVVNFKLMKMN